MQELSKLPTKELLAEYNRRAAAVGEKPLASWKSGKDKLVARIEALPSHGVPGPMGSIGGDVEQRRPKKLRAHKSVPLQGQDAATEDYARAVAAAGISPRDSIQVASEKLLEATAYEHDGRKWGIPYGIVLAEIRRVFPDCSTTTACLRWYAVKMNEAGTRLPKRKRSKSP